MLNITQLKAQLKPSNSLVFSQSRQTELKAFVEANCAAEDLFDSKYEYDLDQENCTDIFEYVVPEVEEATSGFIETDEFSQEKRRYGTKGMQPRAKNLVKESCYALARKFGLSRLGFITLTIPGWVKWKIWLICINWQYAMKMFKQKLARLQLARGAPTAMISVSEVQPERLALRGEFALHEHMIIVTTPEADPYNFYISSKEYNDLWLETLELVFDKYARREFELEPANNCVDTKRVNSNPVKYLAKYFSKSKEDCKEAIDKGYERCLPRQWFHENAETVAIRKSYTVDLTHATAKAIYLNLENLKESGLVVDYGETIVEWDSREICVAVWSQVTKEGEQLVRSMNKAPPIDSS